jgi:anti-anti-sigma factor
MQITIEQYGDISALKVKHELSVDNVQQFRKHAEKQLEEGVRRFVLDLEETLFVDSEGLEAFLWLRDECENIFEVAGVKVAAADENVRKILEMTRLDKDFEIYDTVADAVKAFR